MILTNYHISARKSSSFFCTENVTLLQDNVQTNAQLPEVKQLKLPATLTSLCLASSIGSQHDATCICCCRSMGQTYGRTDERTPNLYVDPVQHTLRERSVDNVFTRQS